MLHFLLISCKKCCLGSLHLCKDEPGKIGGQKNPLSRESVDGIGAEYIRDTDRVSWRDGTWKSVTESKT